METSITLEVWAVLVAAPCIVSWLLGEMYGAARIRKLVEQSGMLASGHNDALVMAAPKLQPSIGEGHAPVPSKDAANKPGSERSSHRAEVPVHVAAPSISTAYPRSDAKPTVAAVSVRRQTFDGMPSLAQLHAQAEAIRRSGRVWDDPDLQLKLRETDPIAARVLRHYQSSIDELNEVTGRTEAGMHAGQHVIVTDDQLPCLADAAPLSPHMRSAELAARRMAR